MLIEEAAGITKYKARKKQAEQKMEQTRQNLLRVGDIVSEIERSLASLKRQAAEGRALRRLPQARARRSGAARGVAQALEIIALTKVVLVETEQLEAQLCRRPTTTRREAEVALSEHERLEELRRVSEAEQRRGPACAPAQGRPPRRWPGGRGDAHGASSGASPSMRQRRVKLEDELGRLVYDLEDVERAQGVRSRQT
jgi:hypothetical protein